MKTKTLAKLALCCLALQAGVAGQMALADDASLKTEKEKTSYALGANFGNSVKSSVDNIERFGVDLDMDVLMKGLKDVVAGSPSSLSPAEMDTILKALSEKVQAQQTAKRKEQDAVFKEESAKDNLTEGKEFLAKNKTYQGVTTLSNGLQYVVLKAGTGPIPKPTDTVKVNYRGTFLDGKEFDSSPPGKPFPCSLMPGGVITGWTEILKLMPVGSKWKVFIPPDLAYGPSGRPGIPPNATLVFEMEVVSIDPVK
jgi:FKBP-type peptidyl-prolyl cis-trans isomerase